MAVPTNNFDFQNFYETTLNGDITAGTLVIPLATVPAPSEGLLVINPDGANPEIIFYESKGVNDVTCPADGRGFDSTTAQSWTDGTTVIMAPVGYMFRMLKDGSLYDSSTTGWTNLGRTVSSITNNGNRNYTVGFSDELATKLSPGMRLKLTRTVAASTQCADLESGSTQYFNDTTVSGITFTDDFCAGAWIKLESYTGTQQGIISRYNGTSGWSLRINASGQVELLGNNAGSANYSRITSQQSVPLGRWVHVAAQLDMSAFTATSTTSYIMLDGADVPAAVDRGGTNPTALVQAGNLEVGARNAGEPFDGKISNVFVASAKITQANIRILMTRDITSADTATYSIVSAYTLSNSLNDVNTTSANNLTAQGGAAATNADSPFANLVTPQGTIDVAIVMSISGSSATLQLPEGCTVPATGGISSVVYSTTQNPYQWVSDQSKWEVSAYFPSAFTTSATSNTWVNPSSAQLLVPAGQFMLGYKCSRSRAAVTATSSGFVLSNTVLSQTAASAGSTEEAAKWLASNAIDFYATGSLAITTNGAVNMLAPVVLSSATTYYANWMFQSGAAFLNSSNGMQYLTIFAIPSGL